MPGRCDSYYIAQVAVLTEVSIEFGPLISGSYGKLNRIGPKFQSIFQRLRHGFTSFTRQTELEAPVNAQSMASAFLHEFLRLHGVHTLARSPQYVVTSRFKADYQVTNSSLLHFRQNVA
jgi:hypothetical protein